MKSKDQKKHDQYKKKHSKIFYPSYIPFENDFSLEDLLIDYLLGSSSELLLILDY